MSKLLALLPVEWQINLKENGPIVAAGITFVVVALFYFILATPDKHTHVGFLNVETISTFDNTTDSGSDFRAVVRLPDGAQTTISTRSFAAAQWFVADTCVEKRLRESGKVFYQLAAPFNCLP